MIVVSIAIHVLFYLVALSNHQVIGQTTGTLTAFLWLILSGVTCHVHIMWEE